MEMQKDTEVQAQNDTQAQAEMESPEGMIEEELRERQEQAGMESPEGMAEKDPREREMTEEELLRRIESRMSPEYYRDDLGGYLLHERLPTRIKGKDGSVRRLPPGWILARPDGATGGVTLDSIEFFPTPPAPPMEETGAPAQAAGAAAAAAPAGKSGGFSWPSFFGRRKSGMGAAYAGIPLLDIPPYRSAPSPDAQQPSADVQEPPVEVQDLDEEDKKEHERKSFLALTAEEIAKDTLQAKLLENYGRNAAAALLKNPESRALLENKDAQEVKALLEKVNNVPLTKEGARKYLAKEAAERSIEFFLSHAEQFDAVLSNHPKTAEIWRQWKEARKDVSVEAQSQARILEMRLHSVIETSPDLASALTAATEGMQNGFSRLAEVVEQDPGVLETLYREAPEVFNRFAEVKNSGVLDDIAEFSKSEDAKGALAKMKENVEAISELIQRIGRAIQNAFGKRFSPGA